jgi:hypothetical protein
MGESGPEWRSLIEMEGPGTGRRTEVYRRGGTTYFKSPVTRPLAESGTFWFWSAAIGGNVQLTDAEVVEVLGAAKAAVANKKRQKIVIHRESTAQR